MNELTINGFSALTEEEMMMVDAGGWLRGICAGAGAILGAITGGGWAGALIGAKVGDIIGNAIES